MRQPGEMGLEGFQNKSGCGMLRLAQGKSYRFLVRGRGDVLEELGEPLEGIGL
jgi:hypothetical protein